jgi:sensor histidine kinase regulating citrate/malate metabolism
MGVFIVAMSSIRLESYNVSAWDIAFFIMCLLVYILFIQTSLQISERKHAEQEVIFSRQIVEQQRLHYSKLLEGMQSARLMRHDFALHTRALLGMKDKSSMDDYLRHMVSEYSVPSPGQFCENEAVNMIISHYHLECQKQNIAFDAHTQIASELPIDDMSLCVVIGNLMENALEACSYLDDGRYINLNSRWVDSSQIIMVENSFDGYVRKNEGNMLSRKKNGGLGLSSIRRIASHPGDEVHIHHTGDTFTVIVSLMERG